MLKVDNLVKTFAGAQKRSAKRRPREAGQEEDSSAHVRAIDHVSFTVEPGEMFTLLGPSGCGKTTTLRSIAGLEQPDEGKITIGERTVFSGRAGVRLPPNERPLSMVFQNYAIWPHMDVFGNVAFPLEVRPRNSRLSKKQIRERVNEALETVHLGGLGSRPAVKLSGGQQQRLALARALVTDPDLVLLDEPLSNLDAKLRESMRLELKRLQRGLGLTSMYVTHDQGEALALSSRVAVMNRGKIVQIGKPREIYESPNCQFVAEFIGTSNVMAGTVRTINNDVAEIETSHGMLCSTSWRDLLVGDQVIAMVRPEDIRLNEVASVTGETNGWKGKALAGAYQGDAIDYLIAVDTAEFRCRTGAADHGWTDKDVFMAIDPDRVHVLPPA